MFLFARQFFLSLSIILLFFFLFFLSCIGFFLSRRNAYRLVYKSWSYLFRLILLFLRVRVKKMGKKVKGTYLYYSNHQSFLDIIVVGSELPVSVLMKKELTRYPFFGLMTQVVGAIPVNRYNIASREEAKQKVIKRLKEGFSVHFYPEGTRKKGLQPSDLNLVKRSLFDLAYEEGFKVVPLTLKGTHQMKFTWKFTPIEVIFHFGEAIDPKHFSHKDLFFTEAWSVLIKNFNDF